MRNFRFVPQTFGGVIFLILDRKVRAYFRVPGTPRSISESCRNTQWKGNRTGFVCVGKNLLHQSKFFPHFWLLSESNAQGIPFHQKCGKNLYWKKFVAPKQTFLYQTRRRFIIEYTAGHTFGDYLNRMRKAFLFQNAVFRRGGGLGSSTIFKKFNAHYAPS